MIDFCMFLNLQQTKHNVANNSIYIISQWLNLGKNTTEKKKMPSGEKTGNLTKEQIEWYKKHMFKLTLKEAARHLPVSTAQLCRIRAGQHWSDR